jgi:hypothetical protein
VGRTIAVAHQVFISYSHKDSNFVDQLKQHLKDAGFDVWIDRELLMPGQDWREEIDSAIRTSFALIAIMTPKAYESKYVTYEWAFALGIGKKVVPIMLEKTKLHPRLEALHFVDFTDHWADNWDKLIVPLTKYADDLSKPKSERPRFIEQILDDFESHYPSVRKAAMQRLMESRHSSVIETLIEALEHHLFDVSIEAAFALALYTNFRDPRAVGGLIEAIEQNYDVDIAIEYLSRYGDPKTIPALVKFIYNNEDRINKDSFKTILPRFGPPIIPHMNTLLESEAPDVRELAVSVLSEIGDSSCVSALILLLNDRVFNVRLATVQALIK